MLVGAEENQGEHLLFCRFYSSQLGSCQLSLAEQVGLCHPLDG